MGRIYLHPKLGITLPKLEIIFISDLQFDMSS